MYFLRRVLFLFPLLLVISLLAFLLVRAAPGGPFDRERKPASPDIERQLQIMLALSKSVSDTLGIRETVAHRIVPVHDLGRAASRACGSTEQVARADGSRGTSLAGRRASAAPHRPPLSHTVRLGTILI